MTKAGVDSDDRLLEIEEKYAHATNANGSIPDDMDWLVQEVKRLRTRYKLVKRALHVYNDEREQMIKVSETFLIDAAALQEEATAEGFPIWDSLGAPAEKAP